LVEALSQAALAVARDSDDPLDPVTALAPFTTEPGEMPMVVSQDETVYAFLMAGHTPSGIAHTMTVQTGRRWTAAEVDAAASRVGHSNVARTSSQMAFAAQLELDRLEAALKALWPGVQDSNLLAIDRFLKISERKSKILGLDSPDIKMMLTLGGSEQLDFSALSDDELRAYQALQRKAASAAKQKVVEGRKLS
jgi:hypothetical protein